jgi:ribose transport system substrate-binding protein
MDQLRILVSLITRNNDYQREQEASARMAASQVGASLEVTFADNDAVEQTQQILHFIQSPEIRPNAIVVEPVGTGMPQVAQAAVAKGIAWVVINAGVDYLSRLRLPTNPPVFSVQVDNEQIGRIQGQQIAALLGETGVVLEIEGPAGRDVARLRSKGMNSAKPPGVTVKTLKGDWTERSAYRAMKSWLALSTSRELHVGLIACHNDNMALGVRRAFEEVADTRQREAWLRLPIIGCDGIANAGQTWLKQGRLTATIALPPTLGKALHLLAMAHANGTQPPEVTFVEATSLPAIEQLKRAHAATAG